MPDPVSSAGSSPPSSAPSPATGGGLGCLLRLVWLLLGNLALFLLAAAIAQLRLVRLSGFDAGFGAVVGLLLGVRWLDLRYGSRTTASGAPAPPGAFRRYVLIFLPVALAVWLLAHVLARWGL